MKKKLFCLALAGLVLLTACGSMQQNPAGEEDFPRRVSAVLPHTDQSYWTDLANGMREEADETANLIEVTAEFLRYNLGRLNKITTLGDEVENTKNYVYIQERRFGDRYRFTFEVDESCAGYHVPSMILQPLVENSIRHGLQDRLSGAQIAVRIYRRPPEHICLEVWDNGTGISPEKQAELRRSFAANDDGGHIGLRNVYKRLTLLWGQEVTFEFDSVPGDSAVRIVLPLHDALPDAGDRNAQKGGKEAECPSTDC